MGKQLHGFLKRVSCNCHPLCAKMMTVVGTRQFESQDTKVFLLPQRPPWKILSTLPKVQLWQKKKKRLMLAENYPGAKRLTTNTTFSPRPYIKRHGHHQRFRHIFGSALVLQGYAWEKSLGNPTPRCIIGQPTSPKNNCQDFCVLEGTEKRRMNLRMSQKVSQINFFKKCLEVTLALKKWLFRAFNLTFQFLDFANPNIQ